MKLARRGVEATLALDQLEGEARVLTRPATDALLQVPQAHLDAALAHLGVVERDVVHQHVQGHALPIRGLVADLAHGHAAAHEAVAEGQHARRAVGLLLAHLQRGLVRHATRIGDKAVLQAACTRGLGAQHFRERNAVGVELQVALHHHIAHRCLQRGAHHAGVAVPEHVHADAVDQVPLHAAIEQFHQRTATATTAHVGVVAAARAHRLGALKPGVQRFLAALTRGARTHQILR